MAGKVIIGCKLPHGIVLTHPQTGKNVTIHGMNKQTMKGQLVGLPHATTEIDEEHWAAWIAQHKDFPAVKSGAIFVAKDADAAKGKAKDMADVKTGLEPLPQDSFGVTIRNDKD